MGRCTRLVFAIVSLSAMGGCATTAEFNNTPKEASELSKEKSYLQSHYSDIDKYDRTFAPPTDAPPVQKLEKIWGEPDKKEKRWGEFVLGIGLGIGFVATGYASYPVLAIVYGMYPYPQEEYLWNKGDYEVVAFGRSGIFTRYEKRMHNWKWKRVERKEDSALKH